MEHGLPRRLLDPAPRQEAPDQFASLLRLTVDQDVADIVQLSQDRGESPVQVTILGALRRPGGAELGLRARLRVGA